MIKNLSPSRASQFKTCPKQFKFANVDKIKEPTTEVQAKGTTVHQALEDLYNLPKEERTAENLYNLFRNAWTKVRNNDEHANLFKTVEEEKEWGVDALKLLSNYLTLENPKEIEPLEKERWVRGSLEIPAAKLVSNDNVNNLSPSIPPSLISGRVLIPTASPFNDLKY